MAREPAGLLRHPVNLIAMVVLGVNDHWLKDAWPGAVTGKLSDVAGLVMLPIVAVAAVELLLRRPLGVRLVRGVAAACAGGFALMKLWQPVTQLYAVSLGWVQWVLTGADGMAHTVVVARDATDVLTLPAAAIPVWLAARRTEPSDTGSGLRRARRGPRRNAHPARGAPVRGHRSPPVCRPAA